jgi:tetratricopeptide (TPR) repeat protein
VIDDEDFAELFQLDGQPGPAKKISSETQDRLLASVLAPKKVVSRVLGIAAAAAVALFAGGAIAAVWYATREEPAEPLAEAVRETPREVIVAPSLPEEPDPVLPQEPEPAKRAKKLEAPEDLLAKANELRGQKQWGAAEKTYSRVMRAHPRSQAAYVAAIAAAALRLEHLDDAHGALLLYEKARAISPNGALEADVLFGIAGAHRALGDRADEKRTLEHLLRKYPKSVFVPAAKKRIAELAG